MGILDLLRWLQTYIYIGLISSMVVVSVQNNAQKLYFYMPGVF